MKLPVLWDTLPGQPPLIMGVVNVTPDSFYPGSRYQTTDGIVDAIYQMRQAGADIIDLGAESTRPYAQSVTVEEEKQRLLPIIERIRYEFPDLPLSVDTYKAGTAEACLMAGVHIINDVSGFGWDNRMVEVLLQYQPGYILMHSLDRPGTMQDNPYYGNVITEIMTYWQTKIDILIQNGFPRASIVLDPGIGFGKRCCHNMEIIKNISTLKKIGYPLLIGLSRKRFLGEILGLKDPAERLNATTVMHTWCLLQGADILRVHDIKEAAETRKLVRQLQETVEKV